MKKKILKTRRKSAKKLGITKDTAISLLAELYPDVIDYLVEEYGFYCASCFMAPFETLEEGAIVHNIVGNDFQNLLDEINEIVNKL